METAELKNLIAEMKKIRGKGSHVNLSWQKKINT